VKNWLDMPEESRPHFITFYMPEVDHAGHQYGPDSPEVKDAVHFVDESLTKLFDILNSTALPINYIVVSDHGMINIDQDVLLDFPVKVDSEELDIVKNGTYISVFVKGDKNKSDKIKKWYSQLKEGKNKEYYDVYLHDELPEEFYFGGKNDVYGRVGDIVLLAKAPYYFTNHKIAGSHGYDPVKVKEMQAVFLAYGPQIDEGRKVKPFQNVEIYPLIAKILQLDMPKHKIDGSGKMADEILKR
jgi:predicted AlkP superfamily pyrophosphatase or phosphodiesterase